MDESGALGADIGAELSGAERAKNRVSVSGDRPTMWLVNCGCRQKSTIATLSYSVWVYSTRLKHPEAAMCAEQ